MYTKFLITILCVVALSLLAPQLFAQSNDQPATNGVFLPLVTNKAGNPNPTVTPTPQATTAPGATPSPTPSATPTDTVVRGFFAETQWKTSSGDFEIDGKGGLHLVHAYYEAAGGEAPTGAAYQYCADR